MVGVRGGGVAVRRRQWKLKMRGWKGAGSIRVEATASSRIPGYFPAWKTMPPSRHCALRNRVDELP